MVGDGGDGDKYVTERRARTEEKKTADMGPTTVEAACRAYVEGLPKEIRAQLSALWPARAAPPWPGNFSSSPQPTPRPSATRFGKTTRSGSISSPPTRQATLPNKAGQPPGRVAESRAAQGDANRKDAGSSLAQWRETTNLAAGLKLVAADLPLDRLAGVIVLSDGRDQHPESVAPVAARLRAAGVAVSGILIGSPDTFRDAAVAHIDGPRTVLLGDKATLTARLKCHGFAGKTVTARLWHNGEKVDQRAVVVHGDRFTTDVVLSHLPRKLATNVSHRPVGRRRRNAAHRHGARQRQPGAPSGGYRRPHPTIDGGSRPRWEFRYLRNLFLGRNKAVHVQSVVAHPDEIEGLGRRDPSPPPSLAPRQPRRGRRCRKMPRNG